MVQLLEIGDNKMSLFKKIFNHEYKVLEEYKKVANNIESLANKYSKMSDTELKNMTPLFKEKLAGGQTLDDILPDAFACIREVSTRVLKERPFYCQIIGALAINDGNIAELKTGEGKTLTTILPAYLNALTGKGVHVITVNEYLTERNATWMGPIFEFLGLTVGINKRTLSPKEKQDVYNADITYTTNNEVGFDYLRDNMVINAKDRVLRGLNYAIIDEVDSVLIDEARTPLIISGGSLKTDNLYVDTDKLVKRLKENKGFIIDEKTKTVVLDEEGIKEAEKAFGVDNLYDINNTVLLHYITQSLKANYSMKNDIDYVVSDGKVVIVDQFTGRLMPGRAYSDGLHQAIEAKEGVEIERETKTLATITFQNLFRMYSKLSGMTGTAKTEEEEFREIYNMYVISIPTNKPVIREDCRDLIFATKDGKYKAIVKEIQARHEKGQPVLVGTIAVETSELISSLLKKIHLPHEVLNAKNNAREAEIIAVAGEKGAITIATNMAGRGTDIKLGKGVKELGGLCVIGTERHESRRIDDQLRGRSGRQGDPGLTQFCISFEDDLMIRFGTDRIKPLLQRLGVDGEVSIHNKMLSSSIESAQKRVEGNNFDSRKQLLEYDDVINNQRKIIYEKRNLILDSESIHETVLDTFRNYTEDLVYMHKDEKDKIVSKNELLENINQVLKMDIANIDSDDASFISNFLYETIANQYENKIKEIPTDITNEFEKAIVLRVIDTFWMENINTMSHLREGIHLRGYAQENPLRAYKKEGFELFDNLLINIDRTATAYLLNAEIRQNTERKQVIKGEAVSKDTDKAKPKTVNKVGRNESCPCGSGKKYKNCCMK
jgi:preprotein translocase subunit SecA